LARGKVRQGQAVADELPRVDLVAAAVVGVLGGIAGLAADVLTVTVAHRASWLSALPVSRSARSATTTSAPASASASAWSSRSTPITYPNSPARPACTPEIASSITTAA